MDSSMSLITALIHFTEDRVSLVHIPLEHYASYLQPLLQLLSPVTHSTTEAPDYINHVEMPWAAQHQFLNISITPIECSVVCSKTLALEYFEPVIARMNQSLGPRSDHASISSEDFVVISVEGAGLEAGRRVLDLTSPLAMAGISIFFITTYFSDYILVPAKSRGQVIRALEERGFAFEKSAEAYVNVAAHHRNASSSSSFEYKSPSTPPPTTVSELQVRTLTLLKSRDIVPMVHRDLRLIQCAGRRESPGSHSSHNLGLQIGLTKCLVHPPRFLSLTLTESEPPSLILHEAAFSNFSSGGALLSTKEDCLIPITLNLEPMPFEATGIVCGVAGKLVDGTSGQIVDPVEMSYLSTARAGTVMVEEKDLKRVVDALRAGEYGLDVV